MQSLLHPRKPVYDICTPLWVIILSAVPLHPLAISIVTAGAVLVLQVYIICCDTIVPAFAGQLCIGLDLPGYQGRVGKIEGHIWVAEFISRSDSIAFVEYPIG